MRRSICCLLTGWALLGLFACQEEAFCPIEDETLVLVLADMQVAEAAAQSLLGATRDSTLGFYYDQIYALHQVEEAEFLACFDALQADPQRMLAIFDQVLEELNRQEAQASEEKD
jgi:hypothetical protein